MSTEKLVTITNRFYYNKNRVVFHDVGRSSFKQFDKFEDAYECAMIHVDWDRTKIIIEVFPDEVQETIKKFKKEAVKRKFEANQKRDYESYLQLKKRFEDRPIP